MKAKTFVKDMLLLILILMCLFFTACTLTKSKKEVRSSPEPQKQLKEDKIEKRPAVPREMLKNPKDNKNKTNTTTPIVKNNNESKSAVVKTTADQHIDKPESLLHFTTERSGLLLDAGESPKIIVYLENKGNLKEENVEIHISGFEGKEILKSSEKLIKRINVILPGQKKKVIFPIEINSEVENSTLILKLSMHKGKDEKPSVIKIKATCRSKEERLYSDIIRKNRNHIRNRIRKCLEYLEKYPDGRYTATIKSLLEDLRWAKAEDIYRQAAAARKVEPGQITEIESIYLSHYGLQGHYSKDAAQILHELQDFQKACTEDTYEIYRQFNEKYQRSPFSPVTGNRVTLKYWKQREEKDPGNSHIWCQVARALMEEKGTLGHRDAKEYYIKTIHADKYNEAAYIGIGKILEFHKNWDKCIEYLEHKRPGSLENHEIYYLLGHAYERKKNQVRACSLYTKAIENIETVIKKGINNINKAKYIPGIDKKTAIVKVRKNPDYLKYLYYRALLYRVMPDFQSAIRDFNRIITVAPASNWANTARDYIEGMR